LPSRSVAPSSATPAVRSPNCMAVSRPAEIMDRGFLSGSSLIPQELRPGKSLARWGPE
jgi:hypothetical protein